MVKPELEPHSPASQSHAHLSGATTSQSEGRYVIGIHSVLLKNFSLQEYLALLGILRR